MPKEKVRTVEMIDTELEFYNRKRRKAFQRMNRAEQERERQRSKMERHSAKMAVLQMEKSNMLAKFSPTINEATYDPHRNA